MYCQNIHPTGVIRGETDSKDADRCGGKGSPAGARTTPAGDMKKMGKFKGPEYCPAIFHDGEMAGIDRNDIAKYIVESGGPLLSVLGTTPRLYKKYPDAKKLMRIENALDMGILLRCVALAHELSIQRMAQRATLLT